MTAAYIPTVGEHAERALASFAKLREADELLPGQLPVVVHAAGIELVLACLGIMRKFPAQARLEFASVLPFTHLEMALMGHDRLGDTPVAEALVLRLLEWAARSPINVNEANVHAASFLTRLTPHLDHWSQRQEAVAVAARMVRRTG